MTRNRDFSPSGSFVQACRVRSAVLPGIGDPGMLANVTGICAF